jgi:hypothetical protein
VWIALIGLVALVVALAQPLMVVFGGMVFGALLDGAAAAARAAHPAHPARFDRAVGGGLGLWFVTYAGGADRRTGRRPARHLQTQALKLVHWAERGGSSRFNTTIQTSPNRALPPPGSSAAWWAG